MSSVPETARIIRVFVSSPGDVAAERAVMDEVVATINRTDGQTSGFRLELFRWEDNVTPQIGPRPQAVVDQQTPAYDIYVGIMSTRFGTPTGRHGSGTEKEFKDALKSWKKAGAPWITFYFCQRGENLRTKEQLTQKKRLLEFREKVESMGIFHEYEHSQEFEERLYQDMISITAHPEF